jgi:hypothetical protein
MANSSTNLVSVFSLCLQVWCVFTKCLLSPGTRIGGSGGSDTIFTTNASVLLRGRFSAAQLQADHIADLKYSGIRNAAVNT